jgi:hypothetical protein
LTTKKYLEKAYKDGALQIKPDQISGFLEDLSTAGQVLTATSLRNACASESGIYTILTHSHINTHQNSTSLSMLHIRWLAYLFDLLVQLIDIRDGKYCCKLPSLVRRKQHCT